jgi:hypothetical protein
MISDREVRVRRLYWTRTVQWGDIAKFDFDSECLGRCSGQIGDGSTLLTEGAFGRPCSEYVDSGRPDRQARHTSPFGAAQNSTRARTGRTTGRPTPTGGTPRTKPNYAPTASRRPDTRMSTPRTATAAPGPGNLPAQPEPISWRPRCSGRRAGTSPDGSTHGACRHLSVTPGRRGQQDPVV